MYTYRNVLQIIINWKWGKWFLNVLLPFVLIKEILESMTLPYFLSMTIHSWFMIAMIHDSWFMIAMIHDSWLPWLMIHDCHDSWFMIAMIVSI